MPYDPKAITEDDRSYAYKVMWLGLPLSIALLVSMQFEAFGVLTALVGGFVCGTFIGLAFAWANDEFVAKQIAFASNWALSFAGCALFVQIVPRARDWDYDPGTMLAISWPIGLLCCATWAVVAALTRYSSAAGLICAALSPLYAVVMHRSDLLVLTTLLAVLIWIKHRPNLRNLKNGTETKIGQKKSEPAL